MSSTFNYYRKVLLQHVAYIYFLSQSVTPVCNRHNNDMKTMMMLMVVVTRVNASNERRNVSIQSQSQWHPPGHATRHHFFSQGSSSWSVDDGTNISASGFNLLSGSSWIPHTTDLLTRDVTQPAKISIQRMRFSCAKSVGCGCGLRNQN